MDVPTTRSPPVPTERVSCSGTTSSAASPTITVAPDVITACPAVRIVAIAASCGALPLCSSSRNRVTISSE